MKNLIIFIILSFVLYVQAFAQNSSPCPTVSIAPLILAIKAGVNATFIAKISGLESKYIVYKWTVSVGTIIEGQGTSAIKINTLGLDSQRITATIEINGFPVGCQNTVNGTANIAPMVHLDYGGKADEYGKASIKEENSKLDNIGLILNKDKELGVFFIFYLAKQNSKSALKIRLARISKYLVENHKISKDRFVFVDGGVGVYKTEIWVQPIENLIRYNGLKLN